jgi:hypothetical protein
VMVTYLTISLTISLFMNIYNKAVQFKGNAWAALFHWHIINTIHGVEIIFSHHGLTE